jgi:regulatory protein YycH of two-component signal transduction system YycFG
MIVAILVILLFIPSLIMAQDKGNTVHWEIVQYQVDRAKIDSLKILEETYYTKIVAEAKRLGIIIDSAMLIMKFGDNEYNVVEVNTYPSWAAIDENFGWEKAFKTIEPNEKKRDKVREAYKWIFEGKSRKSAIYYEAANY